MRNYEEFWGREKRTRDITEAYRGAIKDCPDYTEGNIDATH